jgi:teichuronic acid biosynthesis glycosyltransferase TuaC
VSRLRVLSLSTLFPNPARQAFGGFVAAQMDAVARRGDVDLVMVNPIGLPPWPLAGREPYRTYTRCPERSALGALEIHHPRFVLIPLLGSDSNPRRIVRAVLPLARRLHAKCPFDLVDAQFFFPDGPAAAAIARTLGLPLTIKARGSDVHLWGTRPAALAQIRAAAAQSSGLLAVSEALRRDMVALGLPAERICVHYTGLNRDIFHPTPRPIARRQVNEVGRLAIPSMGPLLVVPAALIPVKGQRLAIEALARLPEARLALAGTGPDEPVLRALSGKLSLSSRVHFLGQVGHAELPLLLSAADVVVMPSQREGLANAWIEALACGTPIVIPDVGGAREVVRHPSAGRIAAREPDEIAQAITEILADPPAQAAVAANVERFSWEANAEALVGLWRQAAGRADA